MTSTAKIDAQAKAIRHVRIKGFNTDRRHRAIYPRTKSDGRTFCGAEGTPDDRSKEVAVATLRDADIRKRLKLPGLSIQDAEELCPACVAKLPKEG